MPSGDNLELGYGRGRVKADLRGLLKVKVFTPPEAEGLEQPDEAFSRSLEQPVRSRPLRDLARQAGRIVICIPDRSRPRVAREILPALLETLGRAGVGPERVGIFVSTGTHGEHSEAELRELVGDGIPGSVAISQNRSGESGRFRTLGTTSRGTPVRINKTVLEADLKIVIGTVAYHYFAGWGGGRKMLVPGAAHFETACANHRLSIDAGGQICPECKSGLLAGNPVNEDMAEAACLIDNVFMINTVLDGWGHVAGFVSGNLEESHAEAVSLARDLLEVRVGGRCDLAIASAGGHPLDLNFIQAHKSIDHAAESVRDGGVIVALAECPNGIGSTDLMDWLDLGSAGAVSGRLLKHYGIHGHTALSLLKKLERLKVVLISSLEDDTVKRMGLVPARDLEHAL
ncbi:MAG: nickel-dependent lactate racemase, partial [bacterium]